MIGDNPKSDIAGGRQSGMRTILVKTGVFDAENSKTSKDGNDIENPADYVVEDFDEAVSLIYKLEKL